MHYQSGRRGTEVTVALVKKQTTEATALSEQIALQNMQGQRIVVTNQFSVSQEVFCSRMDVDVKQGAQTWLVSAQMTCEAMPSTTVLPTTP